MINFSGGKVPELKEMEGRINLPNGKSLYVGGMEHCLRGMNLPVLHANKFPCYWKAVRKKQLHLGDPEYLTAYRGRDLFLNLVDPKVPLFMMESFFAAFDFIDGAHDIDPFVIIHCNQGRSRSASIAFLYMAKKGWLNRDWVKAVGEFGKRYPNWNPGDGLLYFMKDNWEAFNDQEASDLGSK